jgi:hypothetical protein
VLCFAFRFSRRLVSAHSLAKTDFSLSVSIHGERVSIIRINSEYVKPTYNHAL